MVDRPAGAGRSLTLALLLCGAGLVGFGLPGVLGQLALYATLGVLPGMALARLVARDETPAARWTIGITLSPLVSAAAGALLVRLGVPIPVTARAIGIAGGATWVALELLQRHGGPAGAAGSGVPTLVRGLALGLAAALAIPLFTNPLVRMHSDGWLHAALVWEILLRGFPLQDPRFAGLQFGYMWFYQLYIALLTSLRGDDPFLFMAILNVVNGALFVRLAYRLGLALWKRPEAAAGGALLTTLAFNALAWVLGPFGLIRAQLGSVRGWDEVHRFLQSARFLDNRSFYALSAPYAHPVSFLDKFLLGTPLNMGWVMMLLYLAAMLEWVGGAGPSRLVWGACAAAGMLLFHTVVGFSVVPVSIAALALAALWARRGPASPATGRLVGFGAATLFGALATAPYLQSITRGWHSSPQGVQIPLFHVGSVMAWTLATSCAVGLWFAWRAWRARPPGLGVEVGLLGLYAVGMALMSVVVHLRSDNESKLAFQVFVPIAIFGGAAFIPEVRAWFTRWPRWRVVGLLALLFAHLPVMLFGFTMLGRIDPVPRFERQAWEPALYAWIRDSTDVHAVFVDSGGRDVIMVEGRRRLFFGDIDGPELVGYPPVQEPGRRAALADLYESAAHPDSDARVLAAAGRPVYILYAPGTLESDSLRGRIESRRDLFRPVYDRGGCRVFQVEPPAPAADR